MLLKLQIEIRLLSLKLMLILFVVPSLLYSQTLNTPKKKNAFLTPQSKIITSSVKEVAQEEGFFTTYDTDDGLAMDAIHIGQKSSLCDSKGNLWFCTRGNGVSKYNGKTFVNYNATHGLANNTIKSVLEDEHGNIWFGTDGGGVSKYDGKSFQTYNTEDGLGGNIVESMIIDKDGHIWFGTNKGISKLDGTVFTTLNIDELSSKYITCIIEDSLGNIWFGTREGGVNKFDTFEKHKNGTSFSFTTYSKENGLLNNRIISILEDYNKNIWIGTLEGVSKYNFEPDTQNSSNFISYTKKDGLSSNEVMK